MDRYASHLPEPRGWARCCKLRAAGEAALPRQAGLYIRTTVRCPSVVPTPATQVCAAGWAMELSVLASARRADSNPFVAGTTRHALGLLVGERCG
ncbi:hypothetical protein ACFWNN_28835 [Lentzea sp. NPDC058450]|uniref:hypothetical protein n=1 Tax=Lentzea sp. NPDC058450 TaxID=3346505 RepID=UPI003661CB04